MLKSHIFSCNSFNFSLYNQISNAFCIKSYLVTNYDGNPDTTWWNSKKGESGYVDFTNPDATEWYSNRLKKLQEDAGIDSYKFDAGEISWAPSVIFLLLFEKTKSNNFK